MRLMAGTWVTSRGDPTWRAFGPRMACCSVDLCRIEESMRRKVKHAKRLKVRSAGYPVRQVVDCKITDGKARVTLACGHGMEVSQDLSYLEWFTCQECAEG